MRSEPAFLFDLDGTLVDSVYQHVRHDERHWTKRKIEDEARRPFAELCERGDHLVRRVW
jgi:beta-phosphoglucomutase-like phosphatase (HAD superfamily)